MKLTRPRRVANNVGANWAAYGHDSLMMLHMLSRCKRIVHGNCVMTWMSLAKHTMLAFILSKSLPIKAKFSLDAVIDLFH